MAFGRRDGDDGGRAFAQVPFDRAEHRALRRPEHRVEQEGEGVRRVDAGSDPGRQRSQAPEHPGLRRVRVHDVGSNVLEHARQRPPVSEVAVRSNGAHHVEADDANALRFERFEVVREGRIPQHGHAQDDVESGAVLFAREVDDVTTRPADRGLHDVQHPHVASPR